MLLCRTQAYGATNGSVHIIGCVYVCKLSESQQEYMGVFADYVDTVVIEQQPTEEQG